jgi:hypothetical protein
MYKFAKHIACAVIAVLATGCSPKGEEFIGRWQSEKYPDRSATIERNGDAYLVMNSAPSLWKKGQIDTTTTPAVLKDGGLEVKSAFSTATIAHVKATDTLLMPTAGGTSLEYRRVK